MAISVGVAEIALRVDDVAHELLELRGVREPAVALAERSSCAIQPARSSQWHCVQ